MNTQTTTTPAQDKALALLAAPTAVDGAGLVLSPGGADSVHRAASLQLTRSGRKDLLSSPPMAALRRVRAGDAVGLCESDAAALDAFAGAFPRSRLALGLLGARMSANSLARWEALEVAALR